MYVGKVPTPRRRLGEGGEEKSFCQRRELSFAGCARGVWCNSARKRAADAAQCCVGHLSPLGRDATLTSLFFVSDHCAQGGRRFFIHSDVRMNALPFFGRILCVHLSLSLSLFFFFAESRAGRSCALRLESIGIHVRGPDASLDSPAILFPTVVYYIIRNP